MTNVMEMTAVETTAVPAVNLANKTTLIKVSFGLFGNTRKLRKSQYQVEADQSMTSANKKLLDSSELEDIRSADGKLRQWLYTQCLISDDGIHMVALGSLPEVIAEFKKYANETRPALVAKFVARYADLRADAQRRLNGIFNPLDYPSAEAVARQFTFTWRLISHDVPGNVAEIDSLIYTEESAKQSERWTSAIDEIAGVMRGTFAELVAHLNETLTPGPDGKRKKFYETTLTKLQDFLSTFNTRNVLNDADLAEQVNKVRSLIEGTSIEALKTTDTLRDRVRSGMTEVTAKLETLVSARPRMFRDEE